MKEAVRTAVSDYSFVALASIVQAIEVKAELKQISDIAVSSFYFGKSGLDNLIRAKYRTLNDLADNRAKTKRFICSSGRPLDRLLILVAASQIKTLNGQINTVQEQISRAARLVQYQQKTLPVPPVVKEPIDDELPF